MHEIPRSSGVVLDLDDTLYAERAFHESGIRWAAGRLDLRERRKQVRKAIDALHTGGHPLDQLSAASGTDVDTILQWHREHPPEISLYADAERFLRRLRAADVPIAILTDGRSTTQRNKLDALHVTEQVKALLISEETGVEKCDVRAFENAASALGFREPLVYFGDNPEKDVEIPYALGWRVFLLRDRGHNVHVQSTSRAQDIGVPILHSFDEVRVAAR